MVREQIQIFHGSGALNEDGRLGILEMAGFDQLGWVIFMVGME